MNQTQQQSVNMNIEVGLSEDALFFVVRCRSGLVLSQAWIPVQFADQLCTLIKERQRQAAGAIVPANATSDKVDWSKPAKEKLS